MVERLLCMQEVWGSIPHVSIHFLFLSRTCGAGRRGEAQHCGEATEKVEATQLTVPSRGFGALAVCRSCMNSVDAIHL